jgi:hypothetical protein
MRAMRAGDAVASFDSASAFLASLSCALEGRAFPYLGQSGMKVPLVRASGLLPAPLRRRAYAFASGREGVPPDRLATIDTESVASWVAGHYRDEPAPAVMVGSSNGAITHLAAACGVPWLPQTLLLPVRRPGSDPTDLAGAAAFGARHAPALLAANPAIDLHHMHDANQDALSASQMAYFRIKWNRLPDAYRQFLTHQLQPGAPVVVIRDLSAWPVTRMGDRHVFQVGAQGGMTAEKYLQEPEAPQPDDLAAEAEWGFGQALLDFVHEWATAHRHPVIEIRYHHPQDPAAGVADTFRGWYQGRGEAGQRLLVSSFIVHDPWLTITSSSVPFWTFFPVQPAAADLASYLDETSYEEIDIMLFSHGTRSRGLADIPTWKQLAARAGRRGRLLGVDEAAFPADFAVFARYSKALRTLPGAETPANPLDRIPILDAIDALKATPRIEVRHS